MHAAAAIVSITGVLLSALTNWGLFRYKWIITKFILTILGLALSPYSNW